MNREKALSEIRLATSPAHNSQLKEVSFFLHSVDEKTLLGTHAAITRTNDHDMQEAILQTFIENARSQYEAESSLGMVKVNLLCYDGLTTCNVNWYTAPFYKDGTIRVDGKRRNIINGTTEWEVIDFQHKLTDPACRP